MKIGPIVCFVLAMGMALGGSAQQRGKSPASGRQPPDERSLRIMIPAFPDGGRVPVKYSCLGQGHGVSPAVRWWRVPPGTRSFILWMHDPEAHHKGVEDITHWLIWNIPGKTRELPEGVPAALTLPGGAHQVPSHGATGAYYGPCAPPRGFDHHYIWNLYALDTRLDLPATATRDQVMAAANGHILGSAVWVGLFHR